MSKVIFFTGPPASGKDTQARLLAKKLKGTMITSSLAIEKFFKKLNKGYLKINDKIFSIKKERDKRLKGSFYSPEIVGYIISEKIKKYAGKKDIIISGSPRLIEEAKIEIETLKNLFSPSDYKFIFLNVSEKEIFLRVKKRRRKIEDEEEIVKKRIENFKKYIIPTINYLRKRKLLIEINGEGSVKEVHRRIVNALKDSKIMV